MNHLQVESVNASMPGRSRATQWARVLYIGLASVIVAAAVSGCKGKGKDDKTLYCLTGNSEGADCRAGLSDCKERKKKMDAVYAHLAENAAKRGADTDMWDKETECVSAAELFDGQQSIWCIEQNPGPDGVRFCLPEESACDSLSKTLAEAAQAMNREFDTECFELDVAAE